MAPLIRCYLHVLVECGKFYSRLADLLAIKVLE